MWWNLQLSWQTEEPLKLSREVPWNPDWSALDKGTANIFCVVILVLGWWALSIWHLEMVDKISVDLSNAIKDTTWVLQQMAFPCAMTKWRCSEDDNPQVNWKRCVSMFCEVASLLTYLFAAPKLDHWSRFLFYISLMISACRYYFPHYNFVSFEFNI